MSTQPDTASWKKSTLWTTAFSAEARDHHSDQIKRIEQAYERFRERVAHLLKHIEGELPNLTLHDITHVDALWEVASQIAGPDYPLNPAEALVLGCAFLLHDAAHCRAAYPGGLDTIRQLNEWRDAAARQKFNPDTLQPGSEDFQEVLFATLRILHPKQAKTLAFAKWQDSDGDGDRHLFPDDDLRAAYGDLIGEIAESHWLHPHQLEKFAKAERTAPTCLAPAQWTVDPLKLAVLLRTADACHLDARRAPRFLMLLNQPSGISAVHWQFQSKINQVHCDPAREELLITSSPFAPDEQAAWWQAYDAASLADRELSAADGLLRDFHKPRLAAREVAGVRSPERFAKHVPTQDWHPVDTSLRISNIQSVFERFGGEKLYGDKPWLALRELIQNARDAIHAARSLGYLNADEGEIEVAIEDLDGGHWLHVTDNGIGMSRYVLTEVLLDFGHSLWRSADLGGEWSGLAASGFEAVGQFGIGFFSIFMLGEQVRILTRRCEAKDDESDSGWLLEFPCGTQQRPILKVPASSEKLRKWGTKVSVFLTPEKFEQLHLREDSPFEKSSVLSIQQTCAHLAPALDLDLVVRTPNQRQRVVVANDWKTLPTTELLQRLYPLTYHNDNLKYLNGCLDLLALNDSSGNPVGRCGLSFGYRSKAAIGVTRGIMAGYIEGLTGMVQSQPQTDLARQTAIPDITGEQLQIWAEQQKDILHAQNLLNGLSSAALACFGASHPQLVIGTLGNIEITQQHFIEFLREVDKFAVHGGEIEHDGDDAVRASDFDDFSANSDVLEVEHFGFSRSSKWRNKIQIGSTDTRSWSLEAAFGEGLKTAWGHWSVTHECIQVGNIKGVGIRRLCDVFSRN